jgi:hypothetical protein
LTIGLLEIAIFAKKEKKTRQDRSKGKTTLELFFNSSGIVRMEFISEKSDCKPAPLQGDPSPSTQFSSL